MSTLGRMKGMVCVVTSDLQVVEDDAGAEEVVIDADEVGKL